LDNWIIGLQACLAAWVINPSIHQSITPLFLTMAERAQVTSFEAVEAFRADLIVFLTRARAVLEEASDDVLRTRLWVQNDQRRLWEGETRVRERKLEEARSELFNARLSQFQDSTALQLMAVQRAERAAREAETKLALLKKWDRDLENRTDPMVKQVTQLHGFLTIDMGRAVAYLVQVVKALEAYADVASPGNATSLTPPANKADTGGAPGALQTGTGKPDGGKGKRS
jgi:hypothetical protein